MVRLKRSKVLALQRCWEEGRNVSTKSADSRGKFLQRVKCAQFSLILSVCLGILLYQAGQCLKRYTLKATGTADKYVHIVNTSFPVLDLCPSDNYDATVLKVSGTQVKSKKTYTQRNLSFLSSSKVNGFVSLYIIL